MEDSSFVQVWEMVDEDSQRIITEALDVVDDLEFRCFRCGPDQFLVLSLANADQAYDMYRLVTSVDNRALLVESRDFSAVALGHDGSAEFARVS